MTQRDDDRDDARDDGQDDARDYEVGYGKPPVSGQFKKGQSGNPKGRPKASRNVGTMLEEIFFKKISISDGGVRREVTILEAILRQVANGAAKGDIRYIDRILKLLPILQDTIARADDSGAADTDRATDMAVLGAMADILGSDPATLFATAQEKSRDE